MSEEKMSSENLNWDAAPIINWMLVKGRFCGVQDDLIRQLGQQMLDCGAPLWRLRLTMRTLHPLVLAVTSTWEREAVPQKGIESSHSLERQPNYHGSPFETIRRTRKPFRKRLVAEAEELYHVSLLELKERGCTDYYGIPLEFSDGEVAIMVIATDQAQGFSETDLNSFNRIAAVLAPIVELLNQKRVSLAVAKAYLGERTGQRVLSGQITRGHIEKIDAAILVSDIRDWTGLNHRLGSQTALTHANRYFEVIAQAVESNGGEILKFVGDGVLAIFPVGEGIDPEQVCDNCLAAGRDALNIAQEIKPSLEPRFGMGMHIGEVLYGNIGSQTRIDFTVLGQAVNIAARIEDMCGKFEIEVLFSQEFANLVTTPTKLVSREILKGQSSLSDILTIADNVSPDEPGK